MSSQYYCFSELCKYLQLILFSHLRRLISTERDFCGFLKALNKDSLKLSTRLSMLDQELCDKKIQLESGSGDEQRKVLEEVQTLQKERDHLLKRRNSVDEKLKNGRMLSPEVSKHSF